MSLKSGNLGKKSEFSPGVTEHIHVALGIGEGVMLALAESHLLPCTAPEQAGSLRLASARLPGGNPSDQDLVRAVAHGDRDAMTVLYGRHCKQVYRFLVRRIGDASLAEDLVSEVFLEMWRHADGYRGKSLLSTWLLAIARNKALSAARRRRDEHLDERQMASIADTEESPEGCAQSKDRSATIQKCLGLLSTAHREVIDLVYYHGKTLEQVAAIVGAPLNTVKTRAFHARRQLRSLLEAEGLENLSHVN